VTKLEFKFYNVLISNFSTDLKFDKCFKNLVVECKFVKNLCSTTDFVGTESQKVQINFFSQNQSITQTTVIERATQFFAH